MRTGILAAVLTFAFAQAQPVVVLEGVVTETGTSSPIPSVQIRVDGKRSSDSSAVSLHVSTSVDGRFRISAPPGDYTVTWKREGLFDPLNDGVLYDDGMKKKLVAGQNEAPLKLSLTSGGVVMGRVLTQDGLPANRTSIVAMQLTYGPRGERVIQRVETEDTNERGEYRLYWIPTGDYIVGFSPTVSLTGTLSPTAGVPMLDVQTFYPGTTEVSKARIIHVSPHSETKGIDFSMSGSRVFNLTGRAIYPFVPPPAGQQSSINQNPGISLISTEPGSQRFSAIPSSPTGREQGYFQLRNIPPGRYNMLLSVGPAAGTVAYSAQSTIDIVNQDIEGYSITLRPTVEVPGRVEINAPVKMPDLTFVPAGNMAAVASSRITPSPTGEFTFKGSVGGAFALLPTLPEGLFVADIRQGTRSVYGDGTILIAETNDPIQILLGSNSASVAGTVDGPRNARFTAVLVPDAPGRGNYFLYPTAKVDETGHFRIAGIAPGGYKLFAFGYASGSAWLNAEFLSKHEDAGVTVTVNSTTSVADLRIKGIVPQ